MTNLQRLLEILNTAPATTASTETLIAESGLTITQISEAIRPAVKNDTVIKTGKGKTAVYALPVNTDSMTQTNAPTRKEILAAEDDLAEQKAMVEDLEIADIADLNNPADEVITLKQMCEKHDIAPMTARRKLRKAGITKPGKQWAWSVFSNEAMTMVLNIIVNR